MTEALFVQFILGLIAQLPAEVATIQSLYEDVKTDLSADTQAQIEAAFATANSQLDADAKAHGSTA